MAGWHLDTKMAQDIVARTMRIIDTNINVMDARGRIIGSGDRERTQEGNHRPLNVVEGENSGASFLRSRCRRNRNDHDDHSHPHGLSRLRDEIREPLETTLRLRSPVTRRVQTPLAFPEGRTRVRGPQSHDRGPSPIPPPLGERHDVSAGAAPAPGRARAERAAGHCGASVGGSRCRI